MYIPKLIYKVTKNIPMEIQSWKDPDGSKASRIYKRLS